VLVNVEKIQKYIFWHLYKSNPIFFFAVSPQERAAKDEKDQYNNIVHSFMSYSLYVFKGIDKLERDFKTLPDAYKMQVTRYLNILVLMNYSLSLIPDQLTRAKALRDCTLVNAMFLKRIVEDEKTENDGFVSENYYYH